MLISKIYRFLVVLAVTVCSISFPVQGEKLYKWTDEKGVVHYTDQLSPEADKQGNTELNARGMVLKKNEGSLTPEQEKIRAAEQLRQQEEQKKNQAQYRKDRALLAIYASEQDVAMARKRSLADAEITLEQAKARINTLQTEREKLQQPPINAEISTIDKSKNPSKNKAKTSVPKTTNASLELNALDLEIAAYERTVAEKNKEIAEINARFDADLKRWRELQLNPLKPVAK